VIIGPCDYNNKLCVIITLRSAQIIKTVEGRIGIKIGHFFNAHPIFKGGDTTCRAVIVPGTMINSGGGIPPPSHLVIRALALCQYDHELCGIISEFLLYIKHREDWTQWFTACTRLICAVRDT